jgi:predicted phosphodiesterase
VKLGIMSDLHMEFSPWEFTPEPDVFYINAGDIHSNWLTRERWLSFFPDMFYILGNHDYYHREFGNPYNFMKTKILEDGTKIAGATLWTDLSNFVEWGNYVHNLIDVRFIDKLDYDAYNNAHKIHKQFLLESKADIIVSHHAPSYKSLHPRYIGNIANSGFITELEQDILEMAKPPKLWIHGHVHDPFDYIIGETRVICWPRGYPGEREHFANYQPKVIEI